MIDFISKLDEQLQNIDIRLEQDILQKMARHWDLVADYNRQFNLTAIKDAEQAVSSHYLDCLAVLPILQKKCALAPKAVDIGSGAGYPGLILAMAWPNSQWLLIETLNKKANFLKLVIQELALDNVEVVAERVEDIGQNPCYREQYDLVSSRAVAAINILAEYALPLLKTGGLFAALKGPLCAEEHAQAANALSILQAQKLAIIDYAIPAIGQRSLAIYQKTGSTPAKYPRRAGMVEKRPLT